MPVTTRSSARGAAQAPSTHPSRPTRANVPAAGGRCANGNTKLERKRKGAAGGDPPTKRTRKDIAESTADAGRSKRRPTLTTATAATIAGRVKSRKRARQTSGDSDDTATADAPGSKRTKRSTKAARAVAASTKSATACPNAQVASVPRVATSNVGCPANYHRPLALRAWSTTAQASPPGTAAAIRVPSFQQHITTHRRQEQRTTRTRRRQNIVPAPIQPNLPDKYAGPIFLKGCRWPWFQKRVANGEWRWLRPAPALLQLNGSRTQPPPPSRLWAQSQMRLRADGRVEFASEWSVNGTPLYTAVPRWAPGAWEHLWGVRGAGGRVALRVRGGSQRDNIGEVFCGHDHKRRDIWLPMLLGPCEWYRIPGAMRALPEPRVVPERRQATFRGPWDDGDEEREDEAESVEAWLKKREGE